MYQPAFLFGWGLNFNKKVFYFLKESSAHFSFTLCMTRTVSSVTVNHPLMESFILGDPGADSGSEGKSKQAEKYGTKEK